jgi:hypothetical protein
MYKSTSRLASFKTLTLQLERNFLSSCEGEAGFGSDCIARKQVIKMFRAISKIIYSLL